MAKILITCTQPRADEFATTIPDAISNPALIVHRIETPKPEGDFDAVLMTSRHAAIDNLPNLPKIRIDMGEGGVRDLDLSSYKNILYPCATEPTHIPENCTPWPIYETRTNPDFKIGKPIQIICVFSVKAAKVIKPFIQPHHIILCLSENIADIFRHSNVQKLAVCTRPRYDAMKSLITKETRGTYMTHTDGLKDVETLINRFGGMRPMARKVDVPVSTIQGWKKRDHIPGDRVADIARAAKANQISLDGFDVANTNTPNTKPTTETPSPVAPQQTTTSAAVRPPQSHASTQKYSLDAGQIKRDAVKRSVVTTVSILAVLGGVGYFLFGNEAKEIASVATNQTQLETRLSSFETTVTEGLNSLSDQITDITNQTTPLSVRVAQLETRMKSAGQDIDLGNLVSRFENLTQAVDGQGDRVQAFTDMQSIVNTLQGRMDSLDTALEQAKAENAEMAASMQNVTSRDLSAAAMLLAMTQMRSNLNRSQPFADDLAILQELVGNDDPELTAAINRLAPYAESGVLTTEGLSSEFRGIAGDIVAAALRGEDVSIQDKIMARMGQLLSIEKDGQPIMGIEEQAVIARAQAALDKGDVATAMRELNTLDGEAANAASAFKSQAQGTLNAEQTISMMMQNLLQKLQNPTEIKTMIQNLPQEIEKQTQGQLYQDEASGIVILE